MSTARASQSRVLCIVCSSRVAVLSLAIPTWPLVETRDCGKICGVPRYVYAFDEPCDGGRELLGGKGVGLAEMTQLGVPVPAGFTITTEACRAYMEEQASCRTVSSRRSPSSCGRLEQRTGKRFGDPTDPLLVSVRSGAAVSMPGMMDTILNVGLNDAATAGLAGTTGNARFANDSYRRLIQMYGETVDGSRSAPLRAGAPAPEAQTAASVRTSSSRPTTSRGLVDDVPGDLRAGRRRARSRRTRTSSWSAPSSPSSTRGRRRARRSTAARTTSRTTSAPP